MTDKGQDTPLVTESNSQTPMTVAELQKKLETVTQTLESFQTSFAKLQSAKDREVAAANKRVQEVERQRKETEDQILALTDDPIAKRDLILQQKEAELQRYRFRDNERIAIDQMKAEYIGEWGVPPEKFTGLTTQREVYDAAKQYHKDSLKKPPVVTDSTPASTVPSTAPTPTLLSATEVGKRINELKTIAQSETATKKEKAAARTEFMKLRRPGVIGRRTSV